MNVLQLANGYLGNRLYKNLFAVQKNMGIKNKIYVPVRNGQAVPKGEPDNVIISPCFSQLDRVLFFRKQKNMFRDLMKLDLAQFDLIHAHTVFSGGYSAYQSHKKFGLPYIVAVRNTDVNDFFRWMVHLRKTGIEIMRHAEKIVFLSPRYRDTVIERYVPTRYREELLAKSVVIPNGIASLFLENKGTARKLTDNQIRLIYVGEISSNKNLELTISAVKQLRREGFQISLKVVGEIKETKYCSMMETAEFVEYHERCPLEEVLKHLRNADIFVMPSHTETFGLVYAEAMSQGLPVLYTKGQGFDGQFPEGTVGYAVSDTDSEELSEKIKRIVENYECLSARCIECADKFDWARIAEEYKNIYQKIAGRKDR